LFSILQDLSLSIIFLTSIAVILRIFSNPVANVFQKQLTNNSHHPLTVNFLTYLGLSVLCGFLAFKISWSALPAQFWIYSVLGGLAGALGNSFLVKALQKGDLSVLGPINAYKSVVGILVGILLLAEVPNIWGALGTLLIIGGSYFVLDTTEERFSWSLLRRKEIQYRIWAMILTAIEAVFIKKVILASNVGTSFLSWCWFGTLFSFLILVLNKVSVVAGTMQFTGSVISKYIFLILCIGVMQLTTNFVFDHMPVGYALALFQLSTIVSVLLGQHIFKEENIRKKLIGSAIMLMGSVIIILLK
jgi:drug/metabolite transporter (DMT)-like permease